MVRTGCYGPAFDFDVYELIYVRMFAFEYVCTDATLFLAICMEYVFWNRFQRWMFEIKCLNFVKFYAMLNPTRKVWSRLLGNVVAHKVVIKYFCSWRWWLRRGSGWLGSLVFSSEKLCCLNKWVNFGFGCCLISLVTFASWEYRDFCIVEFVSFGMFNLSILVNKCS